MKKSARFYVFLALGVLILFVIVDSIGVFDSKSYMEVPHGNHTHYLPKDCDPPLPVSDAPTNRPGPNQVIDCTDQIVDIGPS